MLLQKPYWSHIPDKTNNESIRASQKSIFTVCLDAPMPRVSDEMYRTRAGVQMLHGGGSRWNSGNRWFDKTLQVSVNKHAKLKSLSSNFNHTYLLLYYSKAVDEVLSNNTNSTLWEVVAT